MKACSYFAVLIFFLSAGRLAAQSYQGKTPKVTIVSGEVKGINDSGVAIFKGIPFAQMPTGKNRWKPPKTSRKWKDVYEADHFRPRCMQRPIYGDMNFRSKKVSEDCLYLNVWAPAKSNDESLPVLVYFYGGGFRAGDASEYRYDGESMARNKGIVSVTVNYRLGIFGFFSHPMLAAESPHHAAGNYGLLDQIEALKWVQQNIASFGGDPDKVTIAGESAGSISVSALMASPLSKNLFRGVIGESGSILGSFSAIPLLQAEQTGQTFADMIGANSLTELRNISADSLLQAAGRKDAPRFAITIDGYFLPKSPKKIFQKGKQAQVPLLVGWNSGESNYQAILQEKKPTPKNYAQVIQKMYDERADSILEYYPGNSKKQVIESATDLASDRFIAFSTWKWSFLQSKNSNQPVYRYFYSRPRPTPKASKDTARAQYAVHSSEIEYALGNLPTNNVYEWNAGDYRVSHIMQNYFANFVKNGDPNGLGLPPWKPLGEGDKPHFMHIDVHTQLERAQHRERYLYMNQIWDGSKK